MQIWSHLVIYNLCCPELGSAYWHGSFRYCAIVRQTAADVLIFHPGVQDISAFLIKMGHVQET